MDFKTSIDQMFKTLSTSDAKYKSLVKKHLTADTFAKVKDRKTKLGGTLAHCINTGVVNLDSGVGCMACDPEGYEVFSPLLDNVIKDYHKFPMDQEIKHPSPDFGDQNNLPFGDLDPSGEFIVSTRVRVGRSFDGFPFPPLIADKQRLTIEDNAKKAFSKLTGEHKGTYFGLKGMKPDVERQLIDDHFLFKNDDRFNEAAGVYRTWPEGRGIFHNPAKTFLCWLNEEDHLRIISMQMGGNLGEVFKRLVGGIKAIENEMPFSHSKRFGYLTFCPTNLGTTMRASVHMKIPKLAKKLGEDGLKEFCNNLNIQPRGIHGEHTESVGGVYDLSNKRRLGLTEIQAATEMATGIMTIMEEEKKL